MSTTYSIPPAGPMSVSNEIKEHRGWFMLFGIALAVLGAAAIAFPLIATIAVELMIGWVLLFSGLLGIVNAFRTPKWRGFLFSLLGALLSVAVGLLLLFFPMTGILTLTLVMAAFFIVGGVLRVLLALQLRPMDHWGWLLFSGILALVLAGLILFQFPYAAAWVIGLLVGVDLLIAGVILIALATSARTAA